MAAYTGYYYSRRYRWREDPSITCFFWPSSETTSFTEVVPGLGDTILHEEELPSWRNRVARGLNATTNYVASETTLEYSPGLIELDKYCPTVPPRWGHYRYEGDLFLGHTNVWVRPNAPVTTMDEKTRGEALIRALSDARSKQNHFRGGNFLAELTDTIRGLRNPAKGFRDLLDTYHRNARKRVRRACGRRPMPTTQHGFRELERASPDVARAAQRALSDSWLEASFGWTPLISDSVDAYHALRRLALRVPLVRFYGKSSNDGPSSFTSSTRNHDTTRLDFTVQTYTKFEVKYYGAVKVQTTTPPSAQAVEEFGLRTRDFLPAVWEAVPFSFLVDYFTNIGNIIEAVSFPTSDLAWVSRTYLNHSIRSTERVAVKVPSTPAFPATNSTVVKVFQPTRVKWSRKYVDRATFADLSVPGIRFEIPGAKNWKKWANIAALARLRSL